MIQFVSHFSDGLKPPIRNCQTATDLFGAQTLDVPFGKHFMAMKK